MPFDPAFFKPLLGMATSGQPRMFAYRTDDDDGTGAGQIREAGYFNEISNELNVGDQIWSHIDAAGTPDTKIFYVRANT
ncbi:MAG: hypothetical protein ACR2PR_11625, partial [Pseudohongiellaceae bacterium]